MNPIQRKCKDESNQIKCKDEIKTAEITYNSGTYYLQSYNQ